LRSAEILKAVCSGSKYAGCAKPDEAAKGIDAAALAYGVPSVALICIGVEDAKSHDVNYQGQDSGGKQKLEFSRSMEKANEPGFKKADQFFKSVVSPGSEKGGSGGNQTPVNSAALRAKNDAEDFRKMLIMMEKPLTEKLQNNLGPNQNWENIVKLLAARTYMGIEGAAQLAASGSLDGDKVFNFNYPPSLDKFINAVIECTRKAGATKGAKPGQGNRPGN
jgi:hypothetical protein